MLCTADFAELVAAGIAALVTPKPQRAFALIGRLLYPAAASPAADDRRNRHFAARPCRSDGASLEAGVIVEAGAVIGPGVAIGVGHDHCRQRGHRRIVARSAATAMSDPGASVQCALIGNRVIIHGGAQIGQDGFGFVAGRARPERLPQIGRVIIQDDVEIGANTTVDRGAMADTVIGEGTKIDNLVQIAHNVSIGRGCMIAGQCRPVGLGDARRRRSARWRRRNRRSSDDRQQVPSLPRGSA